MTTNQVPQEAERDFHYVVTYNSKTGKARISIAADQLKNGSIWDKKNQKWLEPVDKNGMLQNHEYSDIEYKISRILNQYL